MRAPLVLLGTILALLVAAAGLTRKAAEQRRPPPIELAYDIPPFPAEVARPFSFGLRSLVSDLTFLEAIQINGARKGSVPYAEGQHDDTLLGRLLNYSTELDPQFRGAYRFAGNALPRSSTDGYAGGVLAAQSILKRGVVERADDWQLHFLLGFIDSYYLGQTDDAAKQFAAAARLPGSPKYLGLLATRLATNAGDLDFAEQLANTVLNEASEEATREVWTARLLDIEMERRARFLEAAAARFKARTGHFPEQLSELADPSQPDALPELPPEPHGGSYFIDSTGKVHSTHGDRLSLRNRAQTQSGLIPK